MMGDIANMVSADRERIYLLVRPVFLELLTQCEDERLTDLKVQLEGVKGTIAKNVDAMLTRLETQIKEELRGTEENLYAELEREPF